MKRLRRLAELADDALNPIVVKELRQAVQGRFVSAVLFLFLLVQLATLTVYLLTHNIEMVDVTSGSGYGERVFGFIFAFLLFASMVVLPIFVAVRLYVERAGDSLSLIFVSTLPPWRIVLGKLVANQSLALLLFSACLPFVSFTYFLRGIDLPSILVVFGFGFVMVALAVQGTILLACLPATRFFKVLLGLGGLFGLLTVFSATLTGSMAMVEEGIGSEIGTRDFWLAAGGFLAVAVFFVVLFFLLAVALVSPPMANRARPVRLFLSAAWLVSGVPVALQVFGLRGAAAEAWTTVWTLIAVGACVVAISSRDRMSARVAHEVPRSAPRRVGAFFLSSGSANGVAWALALAVLTLAAGLAMDAFDPSLNLTRTVERAAGVAGYAFAYAMTGLLVHRRFLVSRFATTHTWIVALLLTALGTVAPLIVGFLISPGDLARTSHDWRWQFLNPFAPLQDPIASTATRFGLIWALLAGVLALPWFLRQVRAFNLAPSALR